MLAIGKKVPKLEGTTADGSTISLGALRGKHVAVYFYPKDNTPGCTREAQDFAALYPKFKAKKCEVIGVSRDSAKSHGKFIDKFALPFPLVADEDETWCNAFGVIGEKKLYGKPYVGVIRSTFLIGPDGALLAEWRGVKVPNHASAVLERLASQ